MRAVLWAVVLMAVLGCVRHAPADGKVFAGPGVATPTIPDQQALIVWDAQKREQTLAIETRFEIGSGKEPTRSVGEPGAPEARYAWVVPVPGPEAPRVEAATTGLFPTLRWCFQPRVERIGVSGGFLPWGLAVIVMVLIVGHYQRVSAVGCVGLLFLIVVIVGMLLPALGRARSSLGNEYGVEMLSRSVVGSYEVQVIGASKDAAIDSGKAIAAWLRENGFVMPPACEPVLADYAKRGWVFVASKLRGGAEGERLTPHPIVMRFKTESPVYPLMLTGVGNGDLEVELFVFGAGTASAPGFRVERTGKVHRVEESGSWLGSMPEATLRVGHPGVLGLLGGSGHGTKLVGRLTQEQMSRDAEVWFTTAQERGGTVYTQRAAEGLGVSAGGWVFFVAVLLSGVCAALWKWSLGRTMGMAAVGFVSALFVGVAVTAGAPRLSDTQSVSGGARSNVYRRVREVDLLALEAVRAFEAAARDGASSADAVVLVRAAVRELLDATYPAEHRPGGVERPREQDSPFNFTMRVRDDGRLEVTTYDLVGTPRVSVSGVAAKR